ncbi:MAG: hypothetical protein ACTHOG_06125 [Marmoricola sp.]
MNTRRIVTTAVAAAATLSLTACGSSYKPLAQADFAKSVSQASKTVKSVHMSMKASSRLAIDADFDYNKPVAMQMTMTIKGSGTASSTLSLRLIGNTIYLQVPPATPAGKWVKADAAALGAGGAQSYRNLGLQGLATQFQKGVKSIKYIGSTKIDGQTVQHYTLVADASQLGTSLKALASQVPSIAAIKTINEQLYLTNANVLKRMTVTLPAPVGTMQVDFSGWNNPVTIQAPAPSAIVTSGS